MTAQLPGGEAQLADFVRALDQRRTLGRVAELAQARRLTTCSWPRPGAPWRAHPQPLTHQPTSSRCPMPETTSAPRLSEQLAVIARRSVTRTAAPAAAADPPGPVPADPVRDQRQLSVLGLTDPRVPARQLHRVRARRPVPDGRDARRGLGGTDLAHDIESGFSVAAGADPDAPHRDPGRTARRSARARRRRSGRISGGRGPQRRDDRQRRSRARWC